MEIRRKRKGDRHPFSECVLSEISWRKVIRGENRAKSERIRQKEEETPYRSIEELWNKGQWCDTDHICTFARLFSIYVYVCQFSSFIEFSPLNYKISRFHIFHFWRTEATNVTYAIWVIRYHDPMIHDQILSHLCDSWSCTWSHV